MALDNHHLTLFASTIAAGLGTAVLMAGAGHQGFDATLPASVGNYVSATAMGGALLMLSLLAFVAVVSRGRREGSLRVPTAFFAMALGFASLWFWFVPARTAFIAGSCQTGNVAACSIADRMGGTPRAVARGNDDWVERTCVAGDAELCRLAAARRLVHPTRFCPNVPLGSEFEVVEWCTRSEEGRSLVARR